MSQNTYCQLNDVVRCTDCGATNVVGNLTKIAGAQVPRSDKPGEFWKEFFYFCPCDLDHPLARDPGDGNVELCFKAHVELFKGSGTKLATIEGLFNDYTRALGELVLQQRKDQVPIKEATWDQMELATEAMRNIGTVLSGK